MVPRGGERDNVDEWDNHPRYIRVHDQNALDVGYWHFDLSGISANAEITEARFQVDAQSNSWGNTSVMVVAIVNEGEDWDLNQVPENEIFGGNAPKLDWSDWEDDPDNAMRFNSPLPFFDEGTDKNAEVRQLVDEFEPIFIENQDPNTDGFPDDPGNSYGGYACCDLAPGAPGSADAGDNIWPTKNAVDVDITELVRWKLGQNPDYSSFTPGDRELTLMVRTEIPAVGGANGFVRFISKESEFLGGELDLQPGRIVISGNVGVVGDFDQSGVLDLGDINLLNGTVADATNDAAFDLTGDGMVNNADIRAWVKDLRQSWMGDSNLDGEFNSGDLVGIFQAGKFEQDVDAGWHEGDWSGDRRFNSGDLVVAFQDGGFEQGPVQAVSAVPEPTTLWPLMLFALFARSLWRRR